VSAALRELDKIETKIQITQHADRTFAGGAKWTYADNEIIWANVMAQFEMDSNGRGGGVPAALAHELGPAYADLILNSNDDPRVTEAWTLEFQNTVAYECSGGGYRLEH